VNQILRDEMRKRPNEARTIPLLAQSLAAGAIGGIPDLLGLFVNLPAQGLSYLGTGEFGEPPYPYGFVTRNVQKGLESLTGYKAETPYERAITSAGEVLGGGIGAGSAKAGGTIQRFLSPQTVAEAAQFAGAGAGSQIGAEQYPESMLAPLIGGVVGGAAPTVGLPAAAQAKSTVQNLAQRGLRKALQVSPEKVKTFERAGLEPTLADVSQSRSLKSTQNILREIPIIGTPLQKSINKTQQAIEKLNTSTTQAQAGEIAQKGLRKFQQRGEEIAGKLQQRMRTYVTPDEGIEITNTLEYIQQVPQFATQEAKQQFGASAVGKEFSKLQNIAKRNEGKVPYEDLVFFRREIDDKINNFGFLGFDKQQGQLKNLRAQIQRDIGNLFEQKGGDALNAFQRHNKFYSNFARKNEEIVNRLLKNKTATQTFKDIINNAKVDAKNARTVLNSLKGEEKQVFSESLISELGQSPQNEFAPTTLARKFKALEPESQEIILNGIPKESRSQFRSVIDSIDLIKDTLDLANKSRTAYTNTLTKILTGVGIGYAGSAIGVGKAALLALGGRGVSSKLLTNPKFIKWLAETEKVTSPEKFTSQIAKLQSVAKAQPYIAMDIEQYLQNFENPPDNLNDNIDSQEAKRLYQQYYGNQGQSPLSANDAKVLYSILYGTQQ